MGIEHSAIDAEFPHVSKKLLSLWGTGECMDYLEDLLNYEPSAERPQREGFPFGVMRELQVVQHYHIEQYPEVQCRHKTRKDNPWK